MNRRWSSVPLDRVVHLVGASTAAFELATEPLPDDGPAIVTYYPHPASTMAGVVDALLARLEQSAISLYPEWLPGSEGIDDTGAGVAAIRALAMRGAARSDHFGPFLADLAVQAVRGHGDRTARYPREVRAPALAKVVAASYGRARAAVMIDVPVDMTQAEQRAFGDACEWLVDKGRFGIWLCGTVPPSDRIEIIRPDLPATIVKIVEEDQATAEPPERGQIFYPPIAGRPHHHSSSEKTLEEALRRLAWSQGRQWNQPYPQRPGFVIDLMWMAERCAVEIDGPDHRGALKFAKDRRRDVLLQLDGFAVLRFTNERIAGELDQVLAELKQFLEQQRHHVKEHR